MKKITIQNEATIKASGKLSTGRCKPIVCIETGEVFTSMTDAAETYGVHIVNISNTVRGVQRTCKGKHFCYLSQSLEHLDPIMERLRNASAMEEDARRWREYQAEQEAIRIAEERRIEEERKAEERKQAEIEKLQNRYLNLIDKLNEINAKCEATLRDIAEVENSLRALGVTVKDDA